MKYLLTAILLTISMSVCAGQTQEESIRTKVICEEGYKFLLVWTDSGSWRPPSVVQIYKGGTTPQPIRCK